MEHEKTQMITIVMSLELLYNGNRQELTEPQNSVGWVSHCLLLLPRLHNGWVLAWAGYVLIDCRLNNQLCYLLLSRVFRPPCHRTASPVPGSWLTLGWSNRGDWIIISHSGGNMVTIGFQGTKWKVQDLLSFRLRNAPPLFSPIPVAEENSEWGQIRNRLHLLVRDHRALLERLCISEAMNICGQLLNYSSTVVMRRFLTYVP